MSRLVFDDKARVGAWVAEQVDQFASWGDFYAMGVESQGQITAGIVFNDFNGANAATHIAVKKPSKAFLELLQHAGKYAFVACKLKRLTGLVPASKPKVLAFDKHLGWEEEFVMKSAAPDGGDLHVLVMWPERCKWLKE